jgi:L-lactate dehydrogenase
MSKIQPSGNVVIIGGGNVGASIAFNLVSEEIANEITIIDIAKEMARAQAADLADAANFSFGTTVREGGYDQIQDGDLIVITCGAAQKEGQTRLDLLNINAKIIRSVLDQIKQTGKNVYIIMVTNPVDVLTYIAVQEYGFPQNQVFGSGTYLDTGRLRVYLGQKFEVNPHSVHAYIIGEHGDTSFPALSKASVGGIPLRHFMELNERVYDQLTQEVRQQAYEIIKAKQATYYGIGAAVGELCRIILRNEKRIVALSVLAEGYYEQADVCFGLPVRLGSDGVKFVGELRLNDLEKETLHKSCQVLKESVRLVKGG